MKLALGTVQFGLDYGAFGTGRKVAATEVAQMLDRAASAGVDLLDTARAYGGAEDALAAAGAPGRFRIVTKCPSLRGAPDPAAALLAAFAASCAALGVRQVAGYLMHDAGDLQQPGVWSALQQLQADGRAGRIGVSAYGYDEALALCESYPLTLVQLPANVLQPWFRDRGLPPGVEVHVRSAFLQGFLLGDPDRLPARFRPWRGTLATFRDRAATLGLSPQAAALAPLLNSSHIHRVVVGADTPEQLDQILAAAVAPSADLGDYPGLTPALTDPRTWQDPAT